jgi:hypothetical protein
VTASQSDHIRKAVALRNKRSMPQKAKDWVRDNPEGGIAIMFIAAQAACIIGGLLFPEHFRYLLPANIAVVLKSIAPLGIMALPSIPSPRSSAPPSPTTCWATSRRRTPAPSRRSWASSSAAPSAR